MIKHLKSFNKGDLLYGMKQNVMTSQVEKGILCDVYQGVQIVIKAIDQIGGNQKGPDVRIGIV
jgi:hypothetical protein